MSVLVKNILYQFRYFLVIVAIMVVAALIAVQLHKGSERAAHAEQVGQQLEESNRLAQAEAANQVAESNHLAAIQKDKIEEAQAALQRAADELKAYRIRYLGDHNARYSIAVMVADENGKPNESLAQSICTILDTNGLTTTASLFTPDFIADGLFGQMLSGSKEAFDKLQLTNTVQAVMLARQSVEYSTNAALGAITATMTFDAGAFSTSGFQMIFANSVKVAGPGLTCLEARNMAEERVLKQLQDGRLGQIQKELLAGTK
jgi:hypothetical protein